MPSNTRIMFLSLACAAALLTASAPAQDLPPQPQRRSAAAPAETSGRINRERSAGDNGEMQQCVALAPPSCDCNPPGSEGALPGSIDWGTGGAAGSTSPSGGTAGQSSQYSMSQQSGSDSSASPFGAAGAPQSAAPNMIGDLFGTGSSTFTSRIINGQMLPPHVYTTPSPNASGAGLVGTVKISDNNSPLPRDRVFFDYNYFDGVPLVDGGTGVNRYTPGFEKTFFNRLMSVEMQIPSAATVSPNIVLDGSTRLNRPVFGDLSFAVKALLHQTSTVAASIGLQCTAPTAPGMNLGMFNGTQVARISDDSMHLMPFVGGLYTPNSRVFAQGFVQLDLDTNGNAVATNLSPNGPITSLTPAGRLQSPTFLYVDLGAGYWLYQNDSSRGLTGVAPMFELHTNNSLQHNDVLTVSTTPVGGSSTRYTIGNSASHIQVLNLTVGCFLKLRQNTTITAGYTTTVGNGSDQQFNGELRFFVNHFFGQQSRASLVSF